MEFPRPSRRKEMSTRIKNGKKRESVTRLAWNLGGRGWQGGYMAKQTRKIQASQGGRPGITGAVGGTASEPDCLSSTPQLCHFPVV